MTTGNKSVIKRLYGVRRVYATSGNTIEDNVQYGNLQTIVGRIWSGTNDPGFQSKIERLESATNAYQLDYAKVLYAKQATQFCVMNPSTGHSTRYHATYGQGANVVSWADYEISKNTNLCMHSIFKKLQELETPIQGLEFLGEFKETLHMLRNPAESLAAYANEHASRQLLRLGKHRSQKEILRNRLKSKPRLLKKALTREDAKFSNAVASSILEFNFGAAPLVKTLQQAAEAAVRVFPNKGAVKILTSTHKSEVTAVVLPQTFAIGNGDYTQSIVNVYEYSVTLKVRVKYDGHYDGMSELEQLAAQSGFKWVKLVPVVWELAPLSVFVDYFAGVGSVLEASATETKNVVSVDRYVTRKLIRRTTLEFLPMTSTSSITSEKGFVTTYFKRYTREKWALSIPTLVFTTPLQSIKKLTNLAAFVKLAFFK